MAKGNAVNKYEPVGTEVQTLRVENLWVQCKPGENAEELVDKLEALIKRFSEEGNWQFKWDVET